MLAPNSLFFREQVLRSSHFPQHLFAPTPILIAEDFSPLFSSLLTKNPRIERYGDFFIHLTGIITIFVLYA